jgi:hypothetical protein
MNRFGHRLSSGVGFIEFTDGDKSDHGIDHDDSFTAGEGVPLENKLYLDVHTKAYETLKAKAELLDEPIEVSGIVRHEVEKTFDHELFHHVHGALLTATELGTWQTALEAEPDPDINSYMSDLVDQGAPTRRLQVEQFAIRGELYMDDPLSAAYKYEKSFTFFNGLLGRYNPARIDTVLAPLRTLRDAGKPEEAARQLAFFSAAFRKRLSEGSF